MTSFIFYKLDRIYLSDATMQEFNLKEGQRIFSGERMKDIISFQLDHIMSTIKTTLLKALGKRAEELISKNPDKIGFLMFKESKIPMPLELMAQLGLYNGYEMKSMDEFINMGDKFNLWLNALGNQN